MTPKILWPDARVDVLARQMWHQYRRVARNIKRSLDELTDTDTPIQEPPTWSQLVRDAGRWNNDAQDSLWAVRREAEIVLMKLEGMRTNAPA